MQVRSQSVPVVAERLVCSQVVEDSCEEITKVTTRQKCRKNHIAGHLTVLTLALKKI